MTGDGLPTDLETVLSRTAALGTGPRRIHPATPEGALGAVLDALAACILPRRLTISDEAGLLLGLEAAGGHLIQVTDVSATLQAEAAEVMRRPLRSADLQPIAALFANAFPGEQALTFSTSAAHATPDPAQTGLTCPAILQCLGLTPFDDAVPDRLAHLIEAADEVLIAICHSGQPPVSTHPAAPLPREVCSLAERANNHLQAQPTLLQNNEILFLTPKSHPDLALGLARPKTGPVVLVFMADSLPDIAAYWANMTNAPLLCDPT